MKKVLSIILVLLCVGAAFATGTIKPYLAAIGVHPAILGGWCPTYIGVGTDVAFPLSNGDTIHGNFSIEGGITERALFQNPSTGDYVENGQSEVGLMDVVSIGWNLKSVYDFGDYLKFTLGYTGTFESRKDSMLVTGKYWPKKASTKRWIGGSTKVTPVGINDWLAQFETTDVTAVYPEFGTEYSVFNTFQAEVEFNMMEDTMVANEGFLATLKFNCAPDLLNKDARFFSTNLDLIGAYNLVDVRFKNGLNAFALSFIDRVDINYTAGLKVPTYFQQSLSLGRRVRGFDKGSYASLISAVNNFEIRLSGPEPIDGVFLRTNFFFDFGVGAGELFNSKLAITKPTVLASVGVQEQVDYNDAFDLGIEVAYLLKGKNVKNPTSKLQIGATFALDF